MSTASPDSIQTPVTAFGGLARALRGSWLRMHQYPPLSWITPQLPVRLVQTDGRESLWLGGRRLDASDAQLQATGFIAVELPDDLVLTRYLDVPSMTDADLRDAVLLELKGACPFEPHDMVWGHRARAGARGGQMSVTAVLASRRLVEQWLSKRLVTGAGRPDLPEVWVFDADGSPFVIEGFGEGRRLQRGVRGRLLAYVLILVALLLSVALALTPTLQLRMRAIQAINAYQKAQERAGPAVLQRESLLRSRENLAGLRELMVDHIDPLVVLDLLTRLIPDDTWVQRVQAQGAKFTLSGQTPNAAGLMNTLSGHPGLRDVRAPSPASRAAGAAKESFVVEFTVDAKLLVPGNAASQQPPNVASSVVPAMPASSAASAASAPKAAIATGGKP